MKLTMTDHNVRSLIHRCEQKEKDGWEFVTKIKKEFRVTDGLTRYKVAMRKKAGFDDNKNI